MGWVLGLSQVIQVVVKKIPAKLLHLPASYWKMVDATDAKVNAPPICPISFSFAFCQLTDQN